MGKFQPYTKKKYEIELTQFQFAEDFPPLVVAYAVVTVTHGMGYTEIEPEGIFTDREHAEMRADEIRVVKGEGMSDIQSGPAGAELLLSHCSLRDVRVLQMELRDTPTPGSEHIRATKEKAKQPASEKTPSARGRD